MIESGLIVLNKPKGMSSFFAVKIVKRALNANKAGHMGTLDPLATGVLVIGINKATKMFDKFLKGDKEYIAEYEFGYETDTLDCEGEVLKRDEKVITKEMIESVLPKFLGKQMQVPPNYSAKKINGKKAYELARSGVDFSIPAKQVEAYNLEVVDQIKNNTFSVKIKCSSGFYVRSLGRDLATELSTYATTINITRTICCGFGINEAQSLEEIKSGNYNLKTTE